MIAINFVLVLLSVAASITSTVAIGDADSKIRPNIPALLPSTIGDGGSIIDNIILPAPGICGINPSIRIKDGITTTINAFPWTALLIIKPIEGGDSKIICGGSLISDQHILTAAHCIQQIPEGTHIAKIRLGEYDIISEQDCIDDKKCADKPIEIEIDNFIIHKDFIGEEIHNDIAIIKLAKKVIFTEYISPVCIPIADNLRIKADIGMIFTIIGWGITEIGQPGIQYKKAIDIIGIDKEICREKYPILKDSEICAGIDSEINSCIGDAGGSMVAPDADGIWYQYGIIINGKECGGIGIPGIYTRIISYIDWIKKSII